MAAVEKELHREMFMESRIARIESDTEHLRKDVSRVEARVDHLDRKFDTKLDALDKKIDTKFGELEKKVGDLSHAFHAFQLQITRQRWLDKVWWLGIAGVLLGVMARGFKWL